jgi:non-specific protein-tyrosine kinase
VELRALLRVINTRGRLIVVVVALALVGALAATLLAPKVYTSGSTVNIGQALTSANPDIAEITASQRLSQTYAQLVTTRPVLQEVIDDLRLPITPEELQSEVSVNAPQDSTLLSIVVNYGDAQTAADIANGLADELVTRSASLRGQDTGVQDFVNQEIEALEEQIAASTTQLQAMLTISNPTPEQQQRMQTIENRLASLRSAYAGFLAYTSASAANQVTVVDPAVAASAPSSPRPTLNFALALVLGTLLALGVAFLVDYLDDSIKTREAAEEITGASVIGAIPRMQGDANSPKTMLATLANPRSVAAEAFRSIRTNLEFTEIDAAVKTILVTSAQQREGKTTVASNLAVAFARAGKSTLLVDGDLRMPGVHRLFGLSQSPGLTNLLRTSPGRLADLSQPADDGNLRIITSGTSPPNPAELVASARMQVVLKRIKTGIDVVIIDSPPINAVTDASVLAGQADGVVLVIDVGSTPKAAARRAAEAIAITGTRILGVVVNRDPHTGRADGFGYYAMHPEASGQSSRRARITGAASRTIRRR